MNDVDAKVGPAQMIGEAVAHLQAGRAAAAATVLDAFLARWQGEPDALHLRGICAYQQDDFGSAVDWLGRAVAGAPDVPEFRFNFGNALRQNGQINEALDAFSEVARLRPDFFPAHRALADSLRDARRFADAARQYECLAQLTPDDPDPWASAGEMHLLVGEHAAALIDLRRGVALQPENCKLWNNLGVALSKSGLLGDGLAAFARAVEIDPHDLRSAGNYANALRDAGLGEAALSRFAQIIARAPQDALLRSNALFSSLYSDRLDPLEVLAEHRRFDLLVPDLAVATVVPASSGAIGSLPGRAVRVAYLSPDFYEHPVAYFIDGVLCHHCPDRVEVFLYSCGLQRDAWSQRLQSRGWHWRDVSDLDDEALQRRAAADGIEVLVDLSGHTGNNRMTALARRLAPIQMHYLGYPFSTGAAAVDFRITDAVVDPPGSEHLASERLLRLSRSYYAYTPPDDAPEISALPLASNGYPTFGVCTNLSKVSPLTLDRWSEILHVLPQSRLLWRAKAFADRNTAERMRAALASRGIAASRITLESWTSASDRWEIYSRIDLALDTFPYNQATNTCEALWMGVPTLTLLGGSHQARMGGSIMDAAGLPQYVANTAADWVAAGGARASAQAELAQVRARMREQLASSALLDVSGMTAELEEIYRQVTRNR